MLRHSCWTGHIPRPIWILALILVLTGASFALTLKETAEVTGDQIYMKDIIEEADDQPWAEISVLAAPAKGSKRPVYKTFVVTVLRHNGFLEEAQSLGGPNKVDVLRLAEPKTEEAVIREVDHSWIWDEVKEEISAYISRLVPEGFAVRLTLVSFPQIAEKENVVDLSVDFGAFRNTFYGRMVVPVHLVFESGSTRRILISVDIAFEGEVLVAKMELRPKDQLDELRVKKEVQVFTLNPNDCFFPSYELEKYQAKNLLRPGDIILKSSIEMVPVKLKGETTKLYYKSGSIYVEISVVLLEDAVVGKMVRARNLASNAEVQGVVQEDGTLALKL